MNIPEGQGSHPSPQDKESTSSDSRSQVPTGYANPCIVCDGTFCSKECEDSYAHREQMALVQYETDTHPMCEHLYNQLSHVRGFTQMNGATYAVYVTNWEKRRQGGCQEN